jgi:hypothetical protein
MPRRKTNKEYAIRLTHKDLGVYFFHYANSLCYYSSNNQTKFMFSNKLNLAKTWKTYSVVEEYIENMIQGASKKRGKDSIIISFGREYPDIPSDYSLQTHRNIYQYLVNVGEIIPKDKLISSKESLEFLQKIFIKESKSINDALIKAKFDDGFDTRLRKLANKIKTYKENYDFLRKYEKFNGAITLDIVDASFNFRNYKLKKLQKLQK